jgi:hypothetical protein
MKNLFLINEEEKERILGLHENATKRQYLSEQSNYFTDQLNNFNKQNQVVVQGQGSDPYQYMKWSNKVWYAKKSEGKNPKWVEAKTQKSIDAIKSKIYSLQPTVTQTKPNKVKTTDPNVVKQQMGSLSTRTYQQLESMKSKEQLKDKPFIVVNKSAAVASLFGPNYTFITNSSITTGRFKDTGVDNKVDKSQKNWFEMSLKDAKTNPTSKDGKRINDWIKKNKDKTGLVSSDGTVSWPVYLTLAAMKQVDVFPFSYDVRTKLGLDITPSGVYGISAGEEEKGYAGAGDDNTFPLIDPDSVGEITPAIHGYAGKDRGDAIKKASSQGFDVDKSKLTRVGSGCINVTPEFLAKMREANPSYVIILPDTGGVVDIKVTTFQKFKVGLTQLGSKCVKSLSSLFS